MPSHNPIGRSRRAKAKTGEPCRAAPLKDSDFCLAHSNEITRESTGFIAANGKAGRPRRRARWT
jgi:hypothetical protein